MIQREDLGEEILKLVDKITNRQSIKGVQAKVGFNIEKLENGTKFSRIAQVT